MKTVLTHLSALEYWRSPQSDAGPARLACRVRSLPRSAPCSAAIGALPPDVRAQLSLPVHVLSLDGRRKSTRSLIVHQAAALPVGSLRSLSQPNGDDTLLVTSPELTFVHLASLLSFPRTVHLGYELCGTYAPDASRPFGVRERPPLTTPAKLAAYLDEIGPVRGVRQARSALAHVLCRSASPPESTLAILLTLPCARGGSGMIRPRMNEPVSLGKRGSWTTDRSGFRCDLLWPDQGVAVEYDSTLCHTGAARIARDAARRNALESLGLTVVTATWRQVANVREYNRFARILAGHLGTRIRPCPDYPKRQQALRRELLSLR